MSRTLSQVAMLGSETDCSHPHSLGGVRASVHLAAVVRFTLQPTRQLIEHCSRAVWCDAKVPRGLGKCCDTAYGRCLPQIRPTTNSDNKVLLLHRDKRDRSRAGDSMCWRPTALAEGFSSRCNTPLVAPYIPPTLLRDSRSSCGVSARCI